MNVFLKFSRVYTLHQSLHVLFWLGGVIHLVQVCGLHSSNVLALSCKRTELVSERREMQRVTNTNMCHMYNVHCTHACTSHHVNIPNTLVLMGLTIDLAEEMNV